MNANVRSHGSTPRVLQLTPPTTNNPFYTRTGDVLRQHGWRVDLSIDQGWLLSSIREDRSSPIILHVHQLEPFYESRPASVAHARARSFVDFLRTCVQEGATLVHTLHNRQRHDQRYPELDRWIVREVCGLSSRIVVLGEAARAHAESITDTPVSVVEHPNYGAFYGPRVDPRVARRVLALDQADFVLLMLGGVKQYKGHRFVLDAIRKVDIPGLRLVIAGGGDADLLRELEMLGQALRKSMRIVAKDIPNRDIPLWYSSADASVFGFSEILMSGSVMLSLTYGVPAVVPDVGCLSEYVDARNGALYRTGDEVSLGRAIRSVRDAALQPQAVSESVERLDIVTQTRQLAGVYRLATRTSG